MSAKVCSVPGCEGRHVARGLCRSHYNKRWHAEHPGSPRESRGINERHGATQTPEYTIWEGVVQRGTNARHERYAGRGIAVCERWRESFAAFLADMGPRPSAEHSIDRIDVNGNYEPGNCRWATTVEQARNTSKVRLYTLNGRTECLGVWALEYGIHRNTIEGRLARGIPLEQALSPLSEAQKLRAARARTTRAARLAARKVAA